MTAAVCLVWPPMRARRPQRYHRKQAWWLACDQAATCPAAHASKNEVSWVQHNIASQVNLDLRCGIAVDVGLDDRLIESAIIVPIDAVRLNRGCVGNRREMLKTANGHIRINCG